MWVKNNKWKRWDLCSVFTSAALSHHCVSWQWAHWRWPAAPPELNIAWRGAEESERQEGTAGAWTQGGIMCHTSKTAKLIDVQTVTSRFRLINHTSSDDILTFYNCARRYTRFQSSLHLSISEECIHPTLFILISLNFGLLNPILCRIQNRNLTWAECIVTILKSSKIQNTVSLP